MRIGDSHMASAAAARWHAATGIHWPDTLLLVAELLGLWLLISFYQIEATRGFVGFFGVVAAAAVLNAHLPARIRPWFQVLTTVVVIGQLLGVDDGAWLLGIGIALFALCHLPGPIWLRAIILVVAGTALAIPRAGIVTSPVPAAVWPVLGSLFMFRAILYVYETAGDSERVPLATRFTYFFMLPNICFPFFPIVDWEAYKQKQTASGSELHRKGSRWILHGVIHLLLYRVVYYHWVVNPASIQDVSRLTQFLIANYALYLRVSGQFHVIVGIVALFGVGLPRTHNLYYLSSSFSDFWNRINIYWKDFMLKLFYYPALLRMRALPVPVAMTLATVWVFFCTWALHIYQRFWLTGQMTSPSTETVFWCVLGVLVLGNLLWRYRAKPKASPARPGLALAFKTALMYVTMTVLWALFTAEDFGEWTGLWRLESFGFVDAAWLAAAFGLIVAFAWMGHATASRWRLIQMKLPAVSTIAAALVCLTAGYALTAGTVGADGTALAVTLRSNRLNVEDDNRVVAGYYEELVNVNQFESLVHLTAITPPDWKAIEVTSAAKPGKDLMFELVPSRRTIFKRATLETNRWGMRDRDYELQKPPGALRIAIMGASYVFGDGVEFQDMYEPLVEEWLNRDFAGGNWSRIELMNFSCSGYFPIARMVAIETKVLAFRPDIVLYIGHANETFGLLKDIIKWHESQPDVLKAWLGGPLRPANLQPVMTRRMLQQKVDPLLPDVLGALYRRLSVVTREAGAQPVFVYWPFTEEADSPDPRRASVIDTARAAGLPLIDLTGMFEEHAQTELRVAPWDSHMNPMAHRLAAVRFHRELSRFITDFTVSRHHVSLEQRVNP